MFADTIIALNKGATVADLNQKLSEVVAAVRATAKAGSISLTLKITPGSKGNADMVFLNASVTAKCPQEEKPATLFFTTDDNRLTRYDERQPELPFGGEAKLVVLKPEAPIKEAM